MPYEMLVNGSPLVILAVFLGFLLKTNADKDKKKDEDNKKREEKYEVLVNEVMDKSEKRESMLMEQLGRYNDSLKDISESIKVIPLMQKDIEELKKNCGGV